LPSDTRNKDGQKIRARKHRIVHDISTTPRRFFSFFRRHCVDCFPNNRPTQCSQYRLICLHAFAKAVVIPENWRTSGCRQRSGRSEPEYCIVRSNMKYEHEQGSRIFWTMNHHPPSTSYHALPINQQTSPPSDEKCPRERENERGKGLLYHTFDYTHLTSLFPFETSSYNHNAEMYPAVGRLDDPPSRKLLPTVASS